MSELIIPIKDGSFQDYLRDESRSTGYAESISFPRTEEELREVVSLVAGQGRQMTVQGARTGLTAAAVPFGGHIINLSRMNRIIGLRYDPKEDTFFATVEPGVLLSELRKALSSFSFDTANWSEDSKQALEEMRARGPYHFTPDPTEISASLGGMINCNASGARSFFYGPTRGYVQALHVVLADGSLVCIRRGEHRVSSGQFDIRTDSGKQISGQLPSYPLPQVKNAAGYHLQPDMDLVDLFVGSEGTLGIVSQAELRLLPRPKAVWGVTAFFPGESTALAFVRTVRGEKVAVVRKVHGVAQPEVAAELPRKPVAIEFFNDDALNLLRRQQEQNPAFGQLQPLPSHYHTAIYLEFHGQCESELKETVLHLGRLITVFGGREEDTWLARNEQDLEQLHFFRHATPESVNLTIDQRRRSNPGLTKLGTDMAVPDDKLAAMMGLYNQRIEDLGLEAVAFGHIGNNHVHVNILPRSLDEYRKGKELYLEWARQAVSWGGTVSAEHGIGKLKTAFLAEMYGQEGLDKMRTVKKMFDPAGLLNPGNMFEQEGRGSKQ